MYSTYKDKFTGTVFAHQLQGHLSESEQARRAHRVDECAGAPPRDWTRRLTRAVVQRGLEFVCDEKAWHAALKYFCFRSTNYSLLVLK